jgi:calcineurin-like phosphoesterase family protein
LKFFTSDTHWYHKNVIKYCQRPFASIEEMNAALIAGWNSVVGPADTVYHGGDFSFGPKRLLPETRKQLNGRIILLRGNHDRKPEVMLAAGIDEVHNTMIATIDGIKVKMRHYPPTWTKWNVVPDFSDEADFFLHGHVHELWRRVGNIINIGVDAWGEKPVTMAQLLACPQDTNPPTGHARCKREPDSWFASTKCTECEGFYREQQRSEAPEAM